MDKFIKWFYLVVVVILMPTFVSCKKEVIEPNSVEENSYIEEIRLYGQWLLLDGFTYVENLTTGERVRYNHFDETKNVSGLRFGNADFPFEIIEKNVTTWSFFEPPSVPGYGEFVLNDEIETPMGFYVTKSNWSIIEHPVSGTTNSQLGGVARPLSAVIYNYSDSIVNFYVQEGYANVNGYNVKYVNELRFKKIQGW